MALRTRQDVSDEGLMLRFQRGDVGAFGELVQRHKVALFNFLLRQLRSRSSAEDALQDVLLRVVQSAAEFKHEARFSTWVYAIARNLCIDHLRRVKARPSGVDLSEELLAALPDEDRDPESCSEAASAREIVWRGLKRLTAISREIIVLRDIQGLSLEEAAGALKVPAGTVKSRSNRARLELARVLSELGLR